MALREIRGSPGKFFDETTGKEFSIMEMREDSKYDTTSRPSAPWWHRVRDGAALNASILGRAEPVSIAQNALLTIYVQELCKELDTYRQSLDDLRARENDLWGQCVALRQKVEQLEETLAKRKARTRRKR